LPLSGSAPPAVQGETRRTVEAELAHVGRPCRAPEAGFDALQSRLPPGPRAVHHDAGGGRVTEPPEPRRGLKCSTAWAWPRRSISVVAGAGF